MSDAFIVIGTSHNTDCTYVRTRGEVWSTDKSKAAEFKSHHEATRFAARARRSNKMATLYNWTVRVTRAGGA